MKKIRKETETPRILKIPALHLIQRWKRTLWMRRSQPLEKASMNILLGLLLLSLYFVFLLFSFFFIFSSSYIIPFSILKASISLSVQVEIDIPLDLSFLDQTTPALQYLARPPNDSDVAAIRSTMNHLLSLDMLSLSSN